MSELTIYRDDAPDAPIARHAAPDAIADALRPIDVRFERWDSPVSIAEDASEAVILDTFRPYLDALMGATGAGSADVLRLTPDHPDAPAMRRKLLSEHRHSEAEIRFFVHGSSHFMLHENGCVYDVHCTQGDLIGVPAGLPHWFDAGPQPRFTALRVFANTTGWIADFTGNPISERFAAGSHGSAAG